MRYQSSVSISNEAVIGLTKFFNTNPEEIIIRKLCSDIVDRYPFNDNLYLKKLTFNFINQVDLDTIKELFSITMDQDYVNFNVKKYNASINFTIFDE